jgi:hypothetical protein
MSTTVKQATGFDDCVNWIEKAVEKKYIKYYDFEEFTNTKELDESSSVGSIFRANWRETDTLLVVKTPTKLTVKEIVNEVSIINCLFILFNNLCLIIFINFITA